MNKLTIFICVFFVGFMACTDQVIEQIPIQYNYGYFPLDSGLYKTYQVKSIIIDTPSDVYDTSNYYIKEIFSGYILDAANDSVMRIERYVKDSLQHNWKILNVWTALVKDRKAIQMEDNIKVIKMMFPERLNLSWDGNALNRLDTLKQYPFEIIGLNEPLAINDYLFDSVLTVKHRFSESLVNKIDDYEQYAFGVGLVYKQMVELNSQTIDPDLPIEERLKTGISYFYTLIDFGYAQ